MTSINQIKLKDNSIASKFFSKHVLKKGSLAFTLAEVLITLAIIGVVAAMTIPALINNINDNDLRIAWRKTFSTMSQAIITLQAQDYYIDLTDNNSFIDSFIQVLKPVAKGTQATIFPAQYNWYKGTGTKPMNEAYPAAALTDGTLISFNIYSSSCTSINNSLTNVCGWIRVDVNGKKGPNMMGKDYYVLWLVNNNNNYRILPFGINGDGYSCAANSTGFGTSEGCSALALYAADKMP